MIKIRFNLSRGQNYMKWKVEYEDSVEYICPSSVHIVMFNARLRNRKASAIKIFCGANKFVCAWIECEDVRIFPSTERNLSDEVSYNPRKFPHWTDESGSDIDGKVFSKLYTKDSKVYAKKT